MKKLLAIALFSLPMAIAPTAYAQTSGTGSAAGGSGSTAGSTTTGAAGSTTPATGNSSSTSGTTDSSAAGSSANSGATGSDAAKSGAAGTNAASSSAMNNSSRATLTDPMAGWSAKDKIIGHAVYNENDEKVGDVNDIILTKDGQVAFFVVGAGGFLGMGEHTVAIPYEKITQGNDRLELRGYTKDQLKEMPAYKPARAARTTAPAASGTLGAPAAPGAAGTAGTPGTTTR